MPIAAVIKGTAYAVHSDHLNTPRKLTQADGQTAWQWAYSAFGDEQPTIGAKRFTSESTTPTTGATSIPEVTFNLRYPGQYFDPETKLHYNYFRTYAPSTGRYTQGDPIGLDGGWNRFGYVDADPLSYFDSFGLCRCENILEQAELLNNDSRYSLRAPYRPGPNTNKCNTFVDDVLESTGVAPRRNWLSMPISAGKWADPTATIPNFPVVTDPRPGDIVAIARWTPDSSGHVAIVKVPGVSTIGAGTEAGSHTTSWPWDLNKFPQGIAVYRRCTCQ
jgi:RHS repeat-associated protein